LTTVEKISISISILAILLPLVINFFQSKKYKKINDQRYLKLNDFRDAQTKLTEEQNQIFRNMNDNMTKFLEKFEFKKVQEIKIETNSKKNKNKVFSETNEISKKPAPISKKVKSITIKK